MKPAGRIRQDHIKNGLIHRLVDNSLCRFDQDKNSENGSWHSPEKVVTVSSIKVPVIRSFVDPSADPDNDSKLHFIGCLFFIAGTILLPLQVGQGAVFSRYHLQWADCFLGLALVIGVLTQRSRIIELVRIWGAFWIAGLLSALFNGTFYALMRWLGLIYVTGMIALVPMYFTILRRQGYHLFLAMVLLALIAVILDAFFQISGLILPYYGQNAPLLKGFVRLKGSFMHPNALAHFLAVTGFLFIYYASGTKLAGVLSGYTIAMVFTVSRSIIAVPMWCWTLVKRSWFLWAVTLSILLILGLSVFFTYYAVDPNLDLIVSFRWKGLQSGLWTWRNNFWLGLGPGSWPMVPEYATTDSPGLPGDAMNTYINLLSTTGLIGFLAYIYGWFRIFQLGNSAGRKADRKLWVALMIYYALTNLFISSEDIRHLYLLTGWMLCLVTLKQPQIASKNVYKEKQISKKVNN